MKSSLKSSSVVSGPASSGKSSVLSGASQKSSAKSSVDNGESVHSSKKSGASVRSSGKSSIISGDAGGGSGQSLHKSSVLSGSNSASSLPEDIAALSLKFPTKTPFADAYERMGADNFTRAIYKLDSRMIDQVVFPIETAFPKNAPFWLHAAIGAIYALRVDSLDREEDSEGVIVQDFFLALKRMEPNLKLIFKILQNIFKAITPGSSHGLFSSGPQLTADNFSEFINSRTQNVSLIAYFSETLRKQSTQVVDALLRDLDIVESVVEMDLAQYLKNLAVVHKSIVRIDNDFTKLFENAGGVSNEGHLVLKVVKLKPQITALRKLFDQRVKAIAQGTAVLLELFKIPQAKMLDQIDKAVDCLDEFNALFHREVDGSDGSSSGESEHSGDSAGSGDDRSQASQEEEEKDVRPIK